MAKQPLHKMDVLDYHTKVQGVANTVADILAEALEEQDTLLLAMLQMELRIAREWIVTNLKSPEEVFKKLASIQKQIVDISDRSIRISANILHGHAGKLAETTARYTAEEIAAIQKARQNERNIRKRTNLKDRLSQTEIRDMLNYKPFVDGRTIGQWFDDLKYNEAARVFRSVQKGIIEGLTVNRIMQEVRGKMGENRRSREMLARTVINATANQSRLEMYQANADVLDGVQWRAALDHRTCIICGAYDGKIWSPDKMHEVKVPPAHPNCRCRLVPYIDIGEGVGRPAEAENFDQMAKEKYEAKYKGKKYDDLSYDYRRKLRYDAIKEYQKNGGEPYKRVESSTTFVDYLKGQSDEFQQEWLGPGKYKLYKDGKLPLEYMVKPDTGFKRTVEDLEQAAGIKPAIEGERNRREADVVKPFGEALEYIKQNQERDDIHIAFLDMIKAEMEYIERSPMTEKERDKAYDKLQKKLNAGCTKHAKETIKALFGEPTENKTFDITYSNSDYYGNKPPGKRDREAVKAVVEDAMPYMQGTLDDIGIEYTQKAELRIFTQPEGWGCKQRGDVILIDLKPKGGVTNMPIKMNPFEGAIHEIMHRIVQDNPHLRQKLQEFINEHNPQLARWHDNENVLYWKLNIPMPSYYCTSIESEKKPFPEELLSMFFTCLTADTSIRHDMDAVIRTGTEFASKYPDYFNGIMNILRGLKK